MARARKGRCVICDKVVIVPLLRRVRGKYVCRRHVAPEIDLDALAP